jgi:hypothetical protein
MLKKHCTTRIFKKKNSGKKDILSKEMGCTYTNLSGYIMFPGKYIDRYSIKKRFSDKFNPNG